MTPHPTQGARALPRRARGGAADGGAAPLGSRLAALVLVAAAALVAGTLLLLRMHFEPPTVPRYVASFPPGAAAVVALRSGDRYEIEMRPEAPVVGAVAARAFLVRGDEVRPWDPPVEIAREGTVRIAGQVDALFAGVPSGPWQLAVAIGRPEVLPTAPRDVLRARDTTPDDRRAAAWRLVLSQIRLEGR